MGRVGSVVGSAEDLVLVALEGCNPGADVSGVLLGIVRDAPLGREEHAGQLRAKLLFRVVGVTETIRFGQRGAVEPRRVARPMGQLMQCRAVVSSSVLEGVLRRQVYAVLGAAVESAIHLVVRNVGVGVLQDLLTRLDGLETRLLFGSVRRNMLDLLSV